MKALASFFHFPDSLRVLGKQIEVARMEWSASTSQVLSHCWVVKMAVLLSALNYFEGLLTFIRVLKRLKCDKFKRNGLKVCSISRSFPSSQTAKQDWELKKGFWTSQELLRCQDSISISARSQIKTCWSTWKPDVWSLLTILPGGTSLRLKPSEMTRTGTN